MMEKKLSVVIVTYKSEKDIYPCLQSLWQHCDIPKEELEIIIVDNSPECEPMFTKLRQQHGSQLVLIHNTHNGGYGQGNNVGIRQATAPVIMIMNPDVRLTEPVFKTVLEEFNKNPALSMYGMKQMVSQEKESTNSFCCTFMMNGYAATLLNAVCTRKDLYLPRYMYLQGSCFFIHREKFEQIGLYDEKVFMYGEEDDIHYRMTQQFGYHIAYNPQLHYIHLTGSRQPDINYQKKRLAATVYFNEKKGYSWKKTVRNFKQTYQLLIAREYIRLKLHKGNAAHYHMAVDFYQYLKNYHYSKEL